MKNKDLQLDTLIRGYHLSCQTEGKSPQTIEWYSAFLARFAPSLSDLIWLSGGGPGSG